VPSEEKHEGWYAPLTAGTWTITLCLPAHEATQVVRLEVNGRNEPLRRAADGSLEFNGNSSPGKPLRWLVGK
jgi:hypothetical protein